MSAGRQNPSPFPPELRNGRGEHLARLLDALAPEIKAEISETTQMLQVSAGDILVEDGAEPRFLGFILDGTLCMKKVLPDGRSHIIGLLVPTDMYGRIFDGASAYRIEALTDARIFLFDRAPFEKILIHAPEIERLFLVSVLDELDAAREWILLLGGRKVIEKVASFLLILSRRKLRGIGANACGDGSFRIHVPIRRADLAQYLGTREESISRAIHELEAQRVLRIQDPYTFDIIDLQALIEVAGHDLITDDG